MKELNNKSVENVIWFLKDLAGYEANDIESNEFEVGCNDDQFCTVSIIELAEDAAAIIAKLTNEAAKVDGNSWVSVKDNAPTNESNLYWVLFPDDKLIMCHLNDYKKLGGPANFWQNLSADDISMDGTKYIEIIRPSVS